MGDVRTTKSTPLEERVSPAEHVLLFADEFCQLYKQFVQLRFYVGVLNSTKKTSRVIFNYKEEAISNAQEFAFEIASDF